MTDTAQRDPAISVLMPVYNSGRHLRGAVDSILGQTFGDFEFLCVDDGSTDDSPAVLREYAGRDGRIRIITKANGGVTSALNAGLAVARGEFIARMDADDLADPTRFELQIEHMRAHPECVAVGCHVINMDGNGVEMNFSPPYVTHEQITHCLWDGNSSALPHYGAFMRRSVLASIGNYREQFRTAQDLDLFLRMSDVGKLANVPKYLMRYRVHEGSVGSKRADEQARNAREILRQAYERRGLKLPKKLAKWTNIHVTTNRVKWGWNALEEGRYADARAHAWTVLLRKPFRKFAWQLAFHATLGPSRTRLRALVRGMRKIAGRPATKPGAKTTEPAAAPGAGGRQG
ncbi:MAG TPA: glycosyltransferase [Tepidisphaeraceae bacterium]|jgi:glycosyltransferase involved in cell wall biosynthesis|nr:glycosyltransferase [Tepidisphaeraceae bacterium]